MRGAGGYRHFSCPQSSSASRLMAGRDGRLMIFVIVSTVPSVGRQLVECVPAWPFA